MTTEQGASANFPQLQRQAQDLLSQLGQLHEGLARELAAARNQLAQREAEQRAKAQELNGYRQQLAQATQQLNTYQESLGHASQELTASREELGHASQELTAMREKLGQAEAHIKDLEGRIGQLTTDNRSLQALQLQWASEREQHLKARQQAEAKHADLNEQLRSLTEEHDKLVELHSGVTEQARSLAAEWNSRRQSHAADSQALRHELEQAGKALESSKQREKQWQSQVYKLQDEVRALRKEIGGMTLTDEQSHHLLSQLNAIVGFAEVLLDEAGSRATGEEREAFLHDIKDSGTHLADYVNRLASTNKREAVPIEAAHSAEPAAPSMGTEASGRVILVVTTDQAMRERIQGYVARPGYEVAFAADAEEGVGLAANLQPLTIMIDNDLPPNGAQDLIDALLREPRTRDIPVVIAGAEDKQLYSMKVDRFDLLSKPINRGQLLQLMVKYDLLADRRRATKMPTTALVIDDDSRNTRLVKAMLKPYAVSVLVADGGAAGIKLAQKHRPDLIILDLMMPDVDGFQVIAALRDDAATKQIPILVYTAKSLTPEDRNRLGGVQTIIRKGELSKEQFMELVYKRGERRQPATGAEAAA